MNSVRTIQRNNVILQDVSSNVSIDKVKSSKDEHLMVVVDNTTDVNKRELVYSTNQQRFDELCALKSFIRDLVRDYATKKSDEYILWTRRLYLHDRKIILSHVVDAEDYEFFCSNPTRLELGLEEYDDVMQRLLDDMCEEVYFEDMSESGRRMVMDIDNGDYVFV